VGELGRGRDRSNHERMLDGAQPVDVHPGPVVAHERTLLGRLQRAEHLERVVRAVGHRCQRRALGPRQAVARPRQLLGEPLHRRADVR
jgi:hypothetical protein